MPGNLTAEAIDKISFVFLTIAFVYISKGRCGTTFCASDVVDDEFGDGFHVGVDFIFGENSVFGCRLCRKKQA
jgi:hypothetical protein